MKIRMYGKTLETWYDVDEKGRKRISQKEISYEEYDTDTGELCSAGSEDFSPARLANETVEKWIWTWDGKHVNKGGHRWFECRGLIRCKRAEIAGVKQYLKNKYLCTDMQLRG